MCLVFAITLSIHNSAQGFPTAQLKIIDFPKKKVCVKYFKLKRVKNSYGSYPTRKRKLCALKIKIKFDDIISIKKYYFRLLPNFLKIYQNITKKTKLNQN
jgi:hypothetical protein